MSWRGTNRPCGMRLSPRTKEMSTWVLTQARPVKLRIALRPSQQSTAPMVIMCPVPAQPGDVRTRQDGVGGGPAAIVSDDDRGLLR